MTEPNRLARNQDKLAEIYSPVRSKFAAVIADLEGHGFRPRIQEAWRSPADQLVAFNSGHSKLKFGLHNATGSSGSKEALAIDIVDDDQPLQESRKFTLMTSASARSHGLDSGIL